MYYQLQMQAENHPKEQRFSCYLYCVPPKTVGEGVAKHCHSYNEIIYCVENTAHIEVNGTNIVLFPGDFFFFPPLVPHATLPHEDAGSSLILQFSNRFFHGLELQSAGLNLLSHHPRLGSAVENCIIHASTNVAMQHIFEGLLEICARFPDDSTPPEKMLQILGICSEDEPLNDVKITPYYWKAKSLTLLLLAELIEQEQLTFEKHTDVSSQELEQLKPLIGEMIQSPEKSMTMEQAAQMVNMSYHHFCRTFKRIFGSSFVEYKNFLRVQYAEQLLAETDKSITEVAELVNFGNLSYFNRIFKYHNGVTPSEYRAKSKIR